jgi:hypothetical protein
MAAAIETSDITPGYNIINAGAPIAKALTDVGGEVSGVIDNALKAHATAVGAQEGADVAAGKSKWQNLPVITDVGKARQAAAETSYLTGIKSDIDTHIATVAQANQYDPAGFKAAADPVISGYIKGAPGPFAVQVQNYAKSKAADYQDSIGKAKLARDDQIHVASMAARQSTLEDTMTTYAGNGGENTPEYQAAHAEWTANAAMKVQNPLYIYSPEQAAGDEAKLTDKLSSAAVSFHTIGAYTDAGGGEAGLAAATKWLHDEVTDGTGALSGVDLPTRLKYGAVALKALKETDAADAESRRIKAEADAAHLAAQRDFAGQLQLGVVMGSVSTKEIYAHEKNGDIEPGRAATLIMGAQAMARREASEARAGAAAERSANYSAAVDLDNNGQLDSKTLAKLAPGLTPLQVRSLHARIDKTAKPVVSNIMALTNGAIHDAGITGAERALKTDNMRAEAHDWARQNPGADLPTQTSYAAALTKKYTGMKINTNPIPATINTHMTRAQSDAAYRQKFTGSHPSQRDLDAHWAVYQAAAKGH